MILAKLYFIATVLFAAFLHPYHVSIFDIEHNTDSKTLQIAVRIFTDDLEDALELLGHTEIKLGTEVENENAEVWIQAYVQEHIKISVNGQELSLGYLGRENEKDLIWCYLESSKVLKLENITVESDLLIAKFDDQTNLVHIKANGIKKSMILKEGRVQETIKY